MDPCVLKPSTGDPKDLLNRLISRSCPRLKQSITGRTYRIHRDRRPLAASLKNVQSNVPYVGYSLEGHTFQHGKPPSNRLSSTYLTTFFFSCIFIMPLQGNHLSKQEWPQCITCSTQLDVPAASCQNSSLD